MLKVIKYTVLQLPVEHPQCFRPLDFKKPLDVDAYKVVYNGVLSILRKDIDKLSLCEQIFMHLNRDDRPRRQEMRSLSVSDLIKFDDGTMFFCDSFGFKPIVIVEEKKEEAEHNG